MKIQKYADREEYCYRKRDENVDVGTEDNIAVNFQNGVQLQGLKE